MIQLQACCIRKAAFSQLARQRRPAQVEHAEGMPCYASPDEPHGLRFGGLAEAGLGSSFVTQEMRRATPVRETQRRQIPTSRVGNIVEGGTSRLPGRNEFARRQVERSRIQIGDHDIRCTANYRQPGTDEPRQSPGFGKPPQVPRVTLQVIGQREALA
jgi:hypothetical protein